MSPDVFFIVFRARVGLALRRVRALRRVSVGICPFIGVIERTRGVWRRAFPVVGGILSARIPRGGTRIYDFQVWLRGRIDNLAMLERI